MTRDPLFPELEALRARTQHAREDVAAARATLEQTHAETLQLITQARQTHPVLWCSDANDELVPLPSATNRDPYEAAYQAVDAIHAILDEFSLPLQIAIVKALGARAAILAQQRQPARFVLSA